MTNNGPGVVEALLFTIEGLPTGVVVRGGNVDGNTIRYNNGLAVGETKSFVLEFFNPRRESFVPTVTVVAVEEITVEAVAGDSFEITRFVALPDESMLVEFESVPGRRYQVQYSDDMATWKTTFPVIETQANRVQWIDNGPPKTSSLPSETPRRFYRILDVTEVD